MVAKKSKIQLFNQILFLSSSKNVLKLSSFVANESGSDPEISIIS